MAALLLTASLAHAQQPPRDPCATAERRPIALDTDVSIDNRVRYEVPGTTFSFCVDYAAMPYSSGHGHQPMIVIDVWSGRDRAHYVVGRGEYISWKHFRIDAHIDRPH